MIADLVLTGVLQSLTLALVAYGVMIPFRLLDFRDLTAEGAYPLGGAVCASMLSIGVAPWWAVLLATLATGLLGVAVSLVHLRLRVNTLLAGIIISTMVYSVNLKVLGKPNVALFDAATLFTSNIGVNICILVGIIIALVVPIAFFLQTEAGLCLRAIGLNPDFARRHGISVAKYTILGLFLGGCSTGLAGSLVVQLQAYMDIGMGVGIVIHALAALMIGESLTGNFTVTRQLLAPLVGAIIYQQIQGLVLALGLAPADLKFFTGAIVLMVIAFKRHKVL